MTLYDTKRLRIYHEINCKLFLKEIILDIGADNPFSIAQLSSGNFVVSLIHEQHRVCTFNAAGYILQYYGGRGGSPNSQLNYPYQLIPDKFDNVLVTDCHNHRVVLLSPTLLSSAKLKYQNINCPIQELYIWMKRELFCL